MADKLLTADQLIKELDKYKHKELHVHHTWRPRHSDFKGSNYQAIQDGMRNYHVRTRGFADIAQHVTLFPDGKFLTGRNFGTIPASIQGYNTGGFCVEMLGDFDKGQDKFEGKQKAAMLQLAKYFYDKGRYIRFHRENAPKTCPGTSIDKNEFMAEVKGFGKSEPSKSVSKPAEVKPESDKKADAPKKETVKNLKKGDKGKDVLAMQKLLNEKGFDAGVADSIFGSNTQLAVLRLQKATNISPDGIYGKKSKEKLEAYKKPTKKADTKTSEVKKAADKYSLPTGVYRQGDKGNAVKQIQEALTKLNFKLGECDSIWGVKTTDAMKRYQQVYLPKEVDGIYGDNSRKSMLAQLNK